MKYPAKLKEGAVVGVIAPSSPIEEERQAQCKAVLEGLGYKVKMADNLSASKGGYMAGEEKARGEWINKMFQDEEVDAVFCQRGGDGANRIIDYIDLDIVRNNKKIFVGYSDVTSLHLLFNQECDLVTFHGPMVSSNMVDQFDEETKNSFMDALTAEKEYAYPAPKGYPVGIAREGRAEGIMTGGNLTVMCASLGTPYEMDTKGRILFIEEIGEHIGNLDRHIYQLRNAGKLKECAGIVLGQFTRCDVDVEGYDIVRVILDATEGLGIPVMYNIQSGHSFPMMTLPMGARCTMDTADKSIVFHVER